MRLVIPELQQRGVYRKAYAGTTLRDHRGLGALRSVHGDTDPVPVGAAIRPQPGVDRVDEKVCQTVTRSNGVAEGCEGRAQGRNTIDDVYLHREGHAARAGCAR